MGFLGNRGVCLSLFKLSYVAVFSPAQARLHAKMLRLWQSRVIPRDPPAPVGKRGQNPIGRVEKMSFPMLKRSMLPIQHSMHE